MAAVCVLTKAFIDLFNKYLLSTWCDHAVKAAGDWPAVEVQSAGSPKALPSKFAQ